MEIILIAALSKNAVIGQNNHLVYNDPEDMTFFKKVTTGNVVVMGRKTWDSIPDKFKPLSDRTNIVVSRNKRLELPDGVLLFNSWEEVKAHLANEKRKIFVMGGGELYASAIGDATTLILSQFKTDLPVDDKTVFFPSFKDNFTLQVQTYPTSKDFIINRYYVKK